MLTSVIGAEGNARSDEDLNTGEILKSTTEKKEPEVGERSRPTDEIPEFGIVFNTGEKSSDSRTTTPRIETLSLLEEELQEASATFVVITGRETPISTSPPPREDIPGTYVGTLGSVPYQATIQQGPTITYTKPLVRVIKGPEEANPTTYSRQPREFPVTLGKPDTPATWAWDYSDVDTRPFRENWEREVRTGDLLSTDQEDPGHSWLEAYGKPRRVEN